jgi:hypothetical protein
MTLDNAHEGTPQAETGTRISASDDTPADRATDRRRHERRSRFSETGIPNETHTRRIP